MAQIYPLLAGQNMHDTSLAVLQSALPAKWACSAQSRKTTVQFRVLLSGVTPPVWDLLTRASFPRFTYNSHCQCSHKVALICL